METIITSHSISPLNLKNPPSLTSKFSPSLFHLRPNFTPFQPSAKLHHSVNDNPRLYSQKRLRASVSQINATEGDEDIWLLEPVGDGDSRHIGFKVAMPAAFEIASKEVTVGRVPEQADIVIPVATVSGTHARFQKKDGTLFVTDLDSTNGTFIDEKRLTPGVPSVVPPGRYITFGDTNLAIFRVSKLRNVKPVANLSELETEEASNVVESTTENV